MNHEDLEIMLDKELEEMLLLEAIEKDINDEFEEKNKEQVLSKKKRRKKFSSKKLKEALNVRTVVILILALIVNTYAWFIYISTVSTGLNIHVKSWEFEFSIDDKIDDVVLFADELYPGMKEVRRTITATNKGETSAELSYSILSFKIFGEDLLEGKDSVNEAELKELLKKYPFELEINMLSNGLPYDSDNPIETGDTVQIEFVLNWEYERKDEEGSTVENDIEDTKLGKKAYDYYHPVDDDGVEIELTEEEKKERSKAIEIIVHIEAIQSKVDNTSDEESEI